MGHICPIGRSWVKLSKSTPSVMIYGETGTTPLHITIEKRMIGYWLQSNINEKQ